jgi:hypothetical protein
VVLVERSAIGDRDFTGGRASELWGRLKAGATVATDVDSAVAAIR